jgi:hypothetical protein
MTRERLAEDALQLRLGKAIVHDGGKKAKVGERGDLAGQDPRPPRIAGPQSEEQGGRSMRLGKCGGKAAAPVVDRAAKDDMRDGGHAWLRCVAAMCAKDVESRLT